MVKIVAWVILLVMVVTLVKVMFGVIAAFVPLLGGIIIGIPLGWVARAIKADGDPA